MPKDKILFVTNKWVDGPNTPISFHYEGLLQTFCEFVDGYDYDVLALDECSIIYGKHIDDAIIQYCSWVDIKTVIIIRLGFSPLNPSISCLKNLKEQGKYLCFFWEDSNPWDLEYQQNNESLIDLNIIFDNPSYNNIPYRNPGSKYLTLWTPESTTIYRPTIQEIPVSFIGSLRYNERAEYVPYVKDKIPELVVGGGQRENNLSVYEYARLLAKSKMTINFPQHGMGYNQVKGKVLHALASKTLLLEKENASTRTLLVPNKDYVEFSTKEDLCEKIQYYLNNEEERLKISEAGYNTYMTKYTGQIFWDTVINKIKDKCKY
jgi:hypothetical protein